MGKVLRVLGVCYAEEHQSSIARSLAYRKRTLIMPHVKSSMMRLFGAETGFDMCRSVFGGYSLWIALAKIVWMRDAGISSFLLLT